MLLSKKKYIVGSLCALIAGLVSLLGCGGSPQQAAPTSAFSGRAVAHADSVLNPETRATGTQSPNTQAGSVSKIGLNPATVIGGASSTARVVLTQAAPAGGALVLITSANPAIVSAPANVNIPAGHTSASVQLSTVPVTSTTSVSITASYNNSFAGANLTVTPPKPPRFTVTLNPISLSLDQGASGSVQLITKGNVTFNHSLLLNAPQQPSGVSVSLNPSVIPAPGSGSSQVSISVASNVAAGNYSIPVTASDGSTTHTATITLTVSAGSSGIVGPLHGCRFKQNGNQYQAVKFTMNSGGTVNFNAILYYGATCDPNQFADQFGFGNPITLGGFTYIFWFSDFHDQMNTSAIWSVGNQTSQCVDYSVAPDCANVQ